MNEEQTLPKLPRELYGHLKWYLDQEIEGMEGYSGKMSYSDELFGRLLMGLDIWFAKQLHLERQKAYRLVNEKVIGEDEKQENPNTKYGYLAEAVKVTRNTLRAQQRDLLQSLEGEGE